MFASGSSNSGPNICYWLLDLPDSNQNCIYNQQSDHDKTIMSFNGFDANLERSSRSQSLAESIDNHFGCTFASCRGLYDIEPDTATQIRMQYTYLQTH